MAGELFTKGLHIMMRCYDATFKLHQRMEAPLFTIRSTSAYRPVQELEARQLVFGLLSENDKYGDKGSDFHHHFERSVASNIYTLLYGCRIETGFEKDLENHRHILVEFTRAGKVGAYLVNSFPVLNRLPKPIAPWKREADKLYQIEAELHTQHLERGLQNPGWNFSKHMRNSPEGSGMPTVELAYDLGVIAGAAFDTTAMTMDWFVVACITKRESFVAKAQQLLEEVVGRDRLPQYDDREDPRLSYMEAIMLEVLRWRPIVAGGIPHAARSQDEYMGYRIPAGAIVLPNMWAITRDEEVYGADADAFIPERWLAHSDNGTESGGDKSPPKLLDLSYTFGYGRRVCPGQHIARNSLWLQMARLLWAFGIEPAVSEETGKRVRVDDTASTDGFITMPLSTKAVFRPRGAWMREAASREWGSGQPDTVKMLNQAGTDHGVKS